MGTVLLIYLSLQFSSHTYHCSSFHIPLITVLSMTLPTSPCILLLLIVVSPALSECPEGWKLMGDSCYLIGDRHMNWFAAQQFCAHNDGHLAEFDSSDQILELLPVYEPYQFDFWIGLNDLIEEGSWIYDYTDSVPTFTGWAEGEPDNYADREDCVMMGLSDPDSWPGPEWYDMACSANYHTGNQGITALCQPN